MSKKDQDVYDWYQHCVAMKREEARPSEYAKAHNLSVKSLCNYSYRFFYTRFKDNPEEFERLKALCEKYQNRPMGMTRGTFCKENDVKESIFADVIQHVSVMKTVERVQNKLDQEKEKPMGFVKIDAPVQKKEQPQEVEVVEPLNDIELKACDGVKVIISPQIESSKIMKIIELLKEL